MIEELIRSRLWIFVANLLSLVPEYLYGRS